MIFTSYLLFSLLTAAIWMASAAPSTFTSSIYRADEIISFPKSNNLSGPNHIFSVASTYQEIIELELEYSKTTFKSNDEIEAFKMILQIISEDDLVNFQKVHSDKNNLTINMFFHAFYVINGFSYYLIRYLVLFGAVDITKHLYSSLESTIFEHGLVTVSSIKYLIATKPLSVALKILVAFKSGLENIGLLDAALNLIKEHTPKDSYFHSKFKELFQINGMVVSSFNFFSGNSEVSQIECLLETRFRHQAADIHFLYSILIDKFDLFDYLSKDHKFRYLFYLIRYDNVDLVAMALYKDTHMIGYVDFKIWANNFFPEFNILDFCILQEAKECFKLIASIAPELLTARMGKSLNTVGQLIKNDCHPTMLKLVIEMGFNAMELVVIEDEKTFNMIQYSFHALRVTSMKIFINHFSKEVFMEQLKAKWPTFGDIIAHCLVNQEYKGTLIMLLDVYGCKLSDQYQYNGVTGNALIFENFAPIRIRRFARSAFIKIIEEELRAQSLKDKN